MTLEQKAPATKAPLLSVSGLSKHFPVTRGVFSKTVGQVKAVDGVSFRLFAGETLGLVGESGCGKTTVGRTLLRLLEPTAGQVDFAGQDVAQLRGEELLRLRREMQIIFQDPFSSLNPRMRVAEIVGEGLRVHRLARGPELQERVAELLGKVGIPRTWAHRYPHEFSGGQRQRIGIARALATEPRLIVCDEAVSALDVSIQAQVINLLSALKREFNIAYLFISHDLSVVRYISDRIAVMYLGKIVELADKESLFARPAHPYTRALLSALPQPDPRRRAVRIPLVGDVPSPLNPPSGCRFHPRCPAAVPRCAEEEPPLVTLAPDHHVQCVHAEGLEGDAEWLVTLDQRLADADPSHTLTAKDAHQATTLSPPPPPPRPASRDRHPPAGPAALAAAEAAPLAPKWHRFTVMVGLAAIVFGQLLFGGFLTLIGYLLGRGAAQNRRAHDLLCAGAVAVALVAAGALARQERQVQELQELQALRAQVEAYRQTTGAYPESLADIGWRLYEVFDHGKLTAEDGRRVRYLRTPTGYEVSLEN